MTRIINIITQMEAGGAQGAAIRMSQAMRARGIDSETWFLYKKVDTYMSEEKVLVIHDRRPNNPIDAWKIVMKMYRLLKSKKTDGVVAYTHYACTLGCIAAKIAGVRGRVATLRNPVWTFQKGVRLLDRIIGSIGFYTTIIAVSDAVVESFKHYPKGYRRRAITVYNGVPKRLSKLNKAEARSKFSLPLGDRILVNVGRLHPQKNQQLLIRMMPHLPKDYFLAIAGDGELDGELKNLITDLGVGERVKMMGEVPPGDIPEFLKAGDIFVFPSNYEAFGFVIFEAAHNGLPIVGSNIPSNRELLKTDQGSSALIVEDMDPEKWALAVKSLEDPVKMSDYINRIEEKSKEYDFEKMVNAYTKHALEPNKS